MCEHPNLTTYVAGSPDEKDPMLCDVAGDASEEPVKSIQKEETQPDKHPAVTKKGDTASVCQDCHMVICDNCIEDHSDQEYNTPTPSQVDFPTQSSSQITKDSSSETEVRDAHVQKEQAGEKESDQIRSNIEDFADPSTEMPDYID